MRRTFWAGAGLLAAGIAVVATLLALRPHPIVGRWELDLPANSTGTGKRLILLSDGTGDLDGTAFRYRVVDDRNLVVTYPAQQLFVWPFELDGDRLSVTVFREAEHYHRVP